MKFYYVDLSEEKDDGVEKRDGEGNDLYECNSSGEMNNNNTYKKLIR